MAKGTSSARRADLTKMNAMVRFHRCIGSLSRRMVQLLEVVRQLSRTLEVKRILSFWGAVNDYFVKF